MTTFNSIWSTSLNQALQLQSNTLLAPLTGSLSVTETSKTGLLKPVNNAKGTQGPLDIILNQVGKSVNDVFSRLSLTKGMNFSQAYTDAFKMSPFEQSSLNLNNNLVSTSISDLAKGIFSQATSTKTMTNPEKEVLMTALLSSVNLGFLNSKSIMQSMDMLTAAVQKTLNDIQDKVQATVGNYYDSYMDGTLKEYNDAFLKGRVNAGLPGQLEVDGEIYRDSPKWFEWIIGGDGDTTTAQTESDIATTLDEGAGAVTAEEVVPETVTTTETVTTPEDPFGGQGPVIFVESPKWFEDQGIDTGLTDEQIAHPEKLYEDPGIGRADEWMKSDIGLNVPDAENSVVEGETALEIEESEVEVPTTPAVAQNPVLEEAAGATEGAVAETQVETVVATATEEVVTNQPQEDSEITGTNETITEVEAAEAEDDGDSVTPPVAAPVEETVSNPSETLSSESKTTDELNVDEGVIKEEEVSTENKTADDSNVVTVTEKHREAAQLFGDMSEFDVSLGNTYLYKDTMMMAGLVFDEKGNAMAQVMVLDMFHSEAPPISVLDVNGESLVGKMENGEVGRYGTAKLEFGENVSINKLFAWGSLWFSEGETRLIIENSNDVRTYNADGHEVKEYYGKISTENGGLTVFAVAEIDGKVDSSWKASGGKINGITYSKSVTNNLTRDSNGQVQNETTIVVDKPTLLSAAEMNALRSRSSSTSKKVQDANASRPVQKMVYSPIILDMNGDGINTVSAEEGVAFDLLGTGQAVQTGWTAGVDDEFLVLDRDGSGAIESGKELFGNQHGAANGYDELAKFDENNDGVIDSKDSVYNRLQLWNDANMNGVSEKGELRGLAESGVASISTGFKTSSFVDAAGNEHRQVSSFTKTNGTRGLTTDVWFRYNAMTAYINNGFPTAR